MQDTVQSSKKKKSKIIMDISMIISSSPPWNGNQVLSLRKKYHKMFHFNQRITNHNTGLLQTLSKA